MGALQNRGIVFGKLYDEDVQNVIEATIAARSHVFDEALTTKEITGLIRTDLGTGE